MKLLNASSPLWVQSCHMTVLSVSGLKELGEATEKGDIVAVKKILGKVNNTDIKIKREGMGKSPLMIACTYGQTPVVDELLQV